MIPEGKMNNVRFLVVSTALFAILIFSCSQTPLEPTTNTIYVNGTNWIYYGSGTAIGGQVSIDPAIISKECKLRIALGDTAYSVVPANSPTINWMWGTLASNVYYSFTFSILNSSDQLIYSISTNIAAPSAGYAVDLSAVKEIYDLTGVKWQIPDSTLHVMSMKHDGGFLYTVEGIGYDQFVLRKYNSSGVLVSTFWTNYSLDGYDVPVQVVGKHIYLAYRDSGIGSPQVVVFSNTGLLLKTWTPSMNYNILYMEVSSSENVYLNEMNDVYYYDSDGNYIGGFGGQGAGTGKFLSLSGMCFDAGGLLNISDVQMGRVQKFDDAGNYQSAMNVPESDLSAIDAAGNLYLASEKWSAAGTFITSLYLPEEDSFVAIDANGQYAYYQDYTGYIYQFMKQ